MRAAKYILLIIAVAAVWWFSSPAPPPISNSTPTLTLGGQEFLVEIADSPAEQIQGLSGRQSLCETCGMLFVFPEARVRSFWMKDMNFPLDIIFIRGGKITEVFADVPIPSGGNIRTVESTEPADQVLELNAGGAKKFGIEPGDPVELPGSESLLGR
ncbi:MAG: hypothetical protein A3K06_00395 [Candidatus Doudnabacteria bacterium RIFCSPHIGHO2_01_52_17]|uniref:DUF192 domain-containing protein n=1 Tax=Candidatus Doudnabacteria bacterium RIFCSPHIGHO2_01_52_17 TaxID=1817820 RepID=A0A1F5NB40_9BACT|nr:MAG: hypothetical protein UY73_C0049G0005 [Parcubacteria group bacterium GW2011_GWA2_52_8]OGE74897.1 MAG: hypothetical protein A3K06_00395 [Candidatus Doudnabacteria bacterium RIFCSPHIGHO2_01_52_17]